MALPSLNERTAYVAGLLQQRGYEPHQVAAIMGSIQQESSFNPWAREAGGTGLGLFQWSYDRRKKVPQATGDFYKDAKAQLNLFEQELAGPESKAGQMLRSARNLDEAGLAMKQFERYGVAGSRDEYMRNYYNKLRGGQLKSAAPRPAPAASAGASPQAGGFDPLSMLGGGMADPGVPRLPTEVVTPGTTSQSPRDFVTAIAMAGVGGGLGGFTGKAGRALNDPLGAAAINAVLGGRSGAAAAPSLPSVDTSDLATGLPTGALPGVAATAQATAARPVGAGGGVIHVGGADPDAERTGKDVVLKGGRGAGIPAPFALRITGTGFQGQGAGESGRGYGNWVSGEFDRDGKRYELLLGHLDRVDVKPGMTLQPGQVLGTQGITGRTFGTHITTHVNPKQGANDRDAWSALDAVIGAWG